MKFYNIFTFSFLLFLFSSQALAIPLEEASYQYFPPTDDPIYGIGKTLEITPLGKDLDESVTLEINTDNIKLLNKEIYLPHIKMFYYESGLGTKNKYIGGELKGNTLIVSINQTGMYFPGVVIPDSKIIFDLPEKKILVGETFPFTTHEIISNQGIPIWDGFPFFVSIRGGAVVGDHKKEGESFVIHSKDGRLSFELKADIPGDLFVSINTQFSGYASHGNFIIPINDTTTEVIPPSKLRIINRTLRWKKSPDKDIAAYFLFYRVKGEEDWGGRDLREIPSPFGLSPQAISYKLRFEAYIPLTYELMLTAVDSIGQESKPSEIVEYKVRIADFSEVEDMIRKEVERLENIVPKSLNFSDLDEHWVKEYVDELTLRGVINGYPDGSFRPDQPVTRAELVKMALKAFGYGGQAVGEKIPFSDVKSDEWFTPYIIQAQNLSFISGYSDQTFQPTKFVNRAEGLKILLKAAGELADEEGGTIDYADVSSSSWYSSYVKDATKKDIVSGYQIQSLSKSNSSTIKIPLWKGMKGDEVIKLQNKLSSLGHYQGPISGYYDDATMKAVYDFQVSEGIVKTAFNPKTNGSLGQKTRLALNSKIVDTSAQDMGGKRYFKPDGFLTRAEVSKMLVRILELRK